jgi:hypothetical protein
MFPIILRVSGNHSASMKFLPIKSPHATMVLGLSWLQRNNPLIDWATGSIIGWSLFCHACCLKSLQPALGRLPAGLGEASNPSAIPTEYQTSGRISIRPATSLPPHPPYNDAINLLPDTTLLQGWLYSLLGPETKTMERYIEDSFAEGSICPFASPAGAGFSLWKRRIKPYTSLSSNEATFLG